jgi:predicted phosphoadenosine phosphosulfate sulfurtransferase
MNSFETSELLIEHIREKTDTVFLSFSCGKDCIGTYLAIKDVFPKIVPFYLYLAPDLEFVERSLTYYEGVMGCRIHRLPHPSLYRMLTNLVFQAPENVAVIQAASFEKFDYDDCLQYLKEDYDYPETAWNAVGVRAVDSPIRMASIRKHGAHNEKRKSFYPIWDWRKARLVEAIQKSGIKLPVDYQLFGRSFDGIDRRFTEPIKKHFPRDYARLCELYPMIEADILRAKYGRQNKATS